jgi:precorrin-6B methylase 2
MDYNDYTAHRVMVRDEVRTSAFQKAIAAQVRPGDVVLDVGAGSGVLSLFAAQAGAGRVYAIERSPLAAAMARHLAQVNGFEGIIHVLEGDAQRIAPIEPVDLLVSEWMGTVGIEENMYGAVLWARDHWLKPEGKVIPVSVTAMAAPVDIAQRVDTGFFSAMPWGLDLNALGETMVNELLLHRRRIEPGNLSAAARPLWKSTALGDPPDAVRQPARARLEYKIASGGAVTALALWFTADLGGGITLATGPDDPDTHWGQMLLPLDKRMPLAKGDVLAAEISAWPVNAGPLMFSWRWRINDGPEQMMDTTGTNQGPPDLAAAAQDDLPDENPPRSALSKFLAVLAMDAEKLAAFLDDPDAVLAASGLSDAQVGALKSRDQAQIGMALFDLEGLK